MVLNDAQDNWLGLAWRRASTTGGRKRGKKGRRQNEIMKGFQPFYRFKGRVDIDARKKKKKKTKGTGTPSIQMGLLGLSSSFFFFGSIHLRGFFSVNFSKSYVVQWVEYIKKISSEESQVQIQALIYLQNEKNI